MAKTPITAANLETSCSARFYGLPKALTRKFVNELFADVLAQYGGKKVSRPEVRVAHGTGKDSFVHSFLCYEWESPVTFLKAGSLRERHYGYILLIERTKHLAVFYKGSGSDSTVRKATSAVSREKLTHAWCKTARYQKLATRRMAIARQELRGAQYEADDLETALPPAVAGRSIPQSVRLEATGFGTVAITPSTGRVQKGGGKADLAELIAFVDDTLAEIAATQESAFLKAFPSPMEISALPKNVAPTGLLVDLASLQDLTMSDDAEFTLARDDGTPGDQNQLCAQLSEVRELQPAKNGAWEAAGAKADQPFAVISKLTHTFKFEAKELDGWVVKDADGKSEPLAKWIRLNEAFSLSFSEPDYFYSTGQLYRRSGFADEAALVMRMFVVHPELDEAESEKGDYKKYTATTATFDDDSIFHVVEHSLGASNATLCCCDLGDEWADYLGFGPNAVTFYHCKDGTPTTGASDFQIVIGQALKNLARVRFRTTEIKEKLEQRKKTATWGKTKIPLLVRGASWDAVIASAVAAAKAPDIQWNVALVVTALSKNDFESELKKPKPKPSFIQLVWLLSAFASSCRERGATPIVYCRT